MAELDNVEDLAVALIRDTGIADATLSALIDNRINPPTNPKMKGIFPLINLQTIDSVDIARNAKAMNGSMFVFCTSAKSSKQAKEVYNAFKAVFHPNRFEDDDVSVVLEESEKPEVFVQKEQGLHIWRGRWRIKAFKKG